jgi:putative redox protein
MALDGVTEAIISENGKSDYSVDISVSGYQLSGDEPTAAGGGSLGPAPYDLLTAALGECTAMTIRWYAKRQNWPLDKVEVKMTHTKEAKVDVFTKQITIYGDALTQEQKDKLIEVAAKCPVQRTLESTPQIRTTV